MRKLLFAVFASVALAGCAGMGHRPPTCKGPLHRINPPQYYQPQPPTPPAVKLDTEHQPTKGSNHGQE